MEPSPTAEPAGMPAPVPRPPTRPDLDFIPDPFPARALPAGFDPADHQRLVVNPFLAVVGLIGWAWLTRRLFQTSFPPLALLPTLFLVWLPFLIHYHCLDCGVTGLFPRWRRHACPRMILRSQRTRRGWFTWPRARTQLIVWLYLLGAGGLLLLILGAGVVWVRG